MRVFDHWCVKTLISPKSITMFCPKKTFLYFSLLSEQSCNRRPLLNKTFIGSSCVPLRSSEVQDPFFQLLTHSRLRTKTVLWILITNNFWWFVFKWFSYNQMTWNQCFTCFRSVSHTHVSTHRQHHSMTGIHSLISADQDIFPIRAFLFKLPFLLHRWRLTPSFHLQQEA